MTTLTITQSVLLTIMTSLFSGMLLYWVGEKHGFVEGFVKGRMYRK